MRENKEHNNYVVQPFGLYPQTMSKGQNHALSFKGAFTITTYVKH